jgi:senataxin
MLEVQYRMHPQIAAYPSQRFYAGKLITDPQSVSADSHHKPYHNDKSGRFKPYLVHDLQYSSEETEGTSLRNREEAKYVLLLFHELITRYPEYKRNIGIIAPYRAQRRYLIQLFKQKYGSYCASLDTEIATVDGFQGREKDIIIFSCVRATPLSSSSSSSSSVPTTSGASGSAIGFLKEWQRLNVAITRAKYALWIVGNSLTLQKDAEWKELLDYSKKQNSVVSLFSEKMSKIPFQVPSSNSSSSSLPHGQQQSSSSSSTNPRSSWNSFDQNNNNNNNNSRNNNNNNNYRHQGDKHKGKNKRERSRDRARDSRGRDRDRPRDHKSSGKHHQKNSSRSRSPPRSQSDNNNNTSNNINSITSSNIDNISNDKKRELTSSSSTTRKEEQDRDLEKERKKSKHEHFKEQDEQQQQPPPPPRFSSSQFESVLHSVANRLTFDR